MKRGIWAVVLVYLLAINLCNASGNTDSLNVIQNDSTEIKDLEASYARANENQDSLAMADSGLRLGEMYLKNGRLKPAIALLEEAYLYNKRTFRQLQLEEACLLLSKVYEFQKKFPSAYYYLLEATALNDSLEARQKDIIRQLQINEKIEFENQEKKLQLNNEELRNENEKYETTLNYFFIATGILFLTLIVMLFVVFNIKRKTTKALKEINSLLEDERNKVAEKPKLEEINFSAGLKSISKRTSNETELALLKKIFHNKQSVPPIEVPEIVTPEIPEKKVNILLEKTIPESLVVLEDSLKKGNWQHIQTSVYNLKQLLMEADMNELLPMINEFSSLDGATPYLTWHQKTKSLVKAVQQKLS